MEGLPLHNEDADATLNPYIAFTDIFINVALIFALLAPLVMLLGNRGWEETRYKEFQKQLEERVVADIPSRTRPVNAPRNDAPGEQRWVFRSSALFPNGSTRLAPQGRDTLRAFAKLLLGHDRLWWRIRVEAHTRQSAAEPSLAEERAAMTLTAERAVEVTMFLYGECGITPNRVVPSGRGHQDLTPSVPRDSPANDRVDLLVLPATVGRTGGALAANPAP
jgi:outer membrane protein OmpA-like peptidoglycan-associated protein